MNEVNDWYDFVDLQMKIMHMCFDFSHHNALTLMFRALTNEKIAGRVH